MHICAMQRKHAISVRTFQTNRRVSRLWHRTLQCSMGTFSFVWFEDSWTAVDWSEGETANDALLFNAHLFTTTLRVIYICFIQMLCHLILIFLHLYVQGVVVALRYGRYVVVIVLKMYENKTRCRSSLSHPKKEMVLYRQALLVC